MKIAVIGASGNAGSRITAELARRGHAVTAIARNPGKIETQANVTAVAGDVMDQAGLISASSFRLGVRRLGKKHHERSRIVAQTKK